jgi:hypothetical protein
MKKFSQKNIKGFVSLYFLGFLLYISVLCTVILENDCHRLRVINNMKEDTVYFQQEKQVLDAFRLFLTRDPDEQDPSFEIHDGTAYYTVEGEYPELVIIYFDPQTKEILDFDAEKYG